MFFYIASHANQLGVFQVDDETGDLLRTVEILRVVDGSSLGAAAAAPTESPGGGSRVSAAVAIFQSPSPSSVWLLRHPSKNYLYVFSACPSPQESLVTTYIIDQRTGRLTKLGVASTGGCLVSYATLSPNGGTTIVLCHKQDGRLVFFDCDANNGVLETPIKVIETPEVRPFTRTTEPPGFIPSIQHCLYTPDGNYLLTVDSSSQTRIWSYPVNQRGIPTTDQPISNLKARPIQHPSGVVQSLMTSYYGPILRQIAFHPSGQYLYLLFEHHCIIQVYEMGPEGKVYADCLQEISCLDTNTAGWFGAAQRAMELSATTDGVWTSTTQGGTILKEQRAGIRRFGYDHPNGARLGPSTMISLDLPGPVSHVCHLPSSVSETTLVAATQDGEQASVVLFTRKQHPDNFQKLATVITGLHPTCVLAVPEKAQQHV